MKWVLCCLALVSSCLAQQCTVDEAQLAGFCTSLVKTNCKASTSKGHSYVLPGNKTTFCAVSEEQVPVSSNNKEQKYLFYKVYLLNGDTARFIWKDADLNGAVLESPFCPILRWFNRDACKDNPSTALSKAENRPGMFSAACTREGQDDQKSEILSGHALRDPSDLEKIWAPIEKKVDFDHYICGVNAPEPQQALYVRYVSTSSISSDSPLRLVGSVVTTQHETAKDNPSAASAVYVFPFQSGERILLASSVPDIKNIKRPPGWKYDKVLLKDAGLTRKLPVKSFAIESAITGGITALSVGLAAKSKVAIPVGSGAAAFGLTFGLEYLLQKRRNRIFLERVSEWLKGGKNDKYQLLLCDKSNENPFEIRIDDVKNVKVMRALSYTPNKSEAFGVEVNTNTR